MNSKASSEPFLKRRHTALFDHYRAVSQNPESSDGLLKQLSLNLALLSKQLNHINLPSCTRFLISVVTAVSAVSVVLAVLFLLVQVS